MSLDITNYSAAALASDIRRGMVSPVDAVEAAIARIDAHNEDLNAVVTRLDDEAESSA